MNYQALNELKMREALLRYMKDAQAVAIDVYLDLNRKLECGISLPSESIFDIVCGSLFSAIKEEVILSDQTSRTKLLLSRAIVDNNPYKLEFVYTIEQRDIVNNLLLSEDYEIGEETDVLQRLAELGVFDGAH